MGVDEFKRDSSFNLSEGLNFIVDQKKLGKLDEIKVNAEKLDSILKGLNPICSFSMAFIVFHQGENQFYTVGNHYLVNNTTNAYDLMNNVYNNFDKLTVRYEFIASDNLIIKY